MSQPLLSHDLPERTFLDNWSCHEDTYCPYPDHILLKPLSPIFFEDESQHSPPQRPHPLSRSDSYLPSPPRTGTPFKSPSLPDICSSSCMDPSDPDAPSYRQSLSRLLTGSHDACCHTQPPSPPLDTPELVQRALPATRQAEPLSPPLTSPVDMLDLPLTTFGSLDRDPSDRGSLLLPRRQDEHADFGVASSSRQQSYWGDDKHSSATLLHNGHISSHSPVQELLTPDSLTWNDGAMLDPLFDDSEMDWSSADSDEHSFVRDLRTPLGEVKPRNHSLDSSQQGSYDFLAAMHHSSLRPSRSYTLPPSMPSAQPSSPQLDGLWDEPQSVDRMDIDDQHLLRSPRSPSLNLNLFDDPESSLLDATGSCQFPDSSLLSQSPRPPPLPLFDDPSLDSTSSGILSGDFVPSSPRSPHMQLLPTGEDDMVTDPSPTDTISPALLGLPEPESVEGLGLDVDAGLDRSPSPSDYEIHLLDGQLDIPLRDLPEDEYQELRSYYDFLIQSEAAAKEREAMLDRRVKDVSALLKPPKAVDDPLVMRARRQEYRSATDLRVEARRVRKEEKHRLRELGTLLDLKLETRVFNTRASLRSVAHLVADMVFKRRDRTRSLANRKVASAPRTLHPSPLRCSFSAEDLRSSVDLDNL